MTFPGAEQPALKNSSGEHAKQSSSKNFFRIELSQLLFELCPHEMLQTRWIILYKAMKLIDDLKAEHMDENRILEPVFKQGLMHWAHSEPLLLAWLVDLHEQAVTKFLVAWSRLFNLLCGSVNRLVGQSLFAFLTFSAFSGVFCITAPAQTLKLTFFICNQFCA